MPRTKKSKFGGDQRQLLAEENSKKAMSASERKIEEGRRVSGADQPRPFAKKVDENFFSVKGNRIIDMELMQDALTKAHVCPEDIYA